MNTKHDAQTGRLIKLFTKQMGDAEYWEDIAQHGIREGVAGFIYTADIIKFFRTCGQDIFWTMTVRSSCSNDELIAWIMPDDSVLKYDPIGVTAKLLEIAQGADLPEGDRNFDYRHAIQQLVWGAAELLAPLALEDMEYLLDIDRDTEIA